jgi:hypothetical protein
VLTRIALPPSLEKGASLRHSLGVGVCLEEAALLFGLRWAVRSQPEGEESGVLLKACLPKGAKAEMAETKDG